MKKFAFLFVRIAVFVPLGVILGGFYLLKVIGEHGENALTEICEALDVAIGRCE